MEGQEKLVDWGVRSIRGDKNPGSLEKIREMIGHTQPGVLVMEDTSSKLVRRSSRIQALQGDIIALAKGLGVRVVVYSREKVRGTFFDGGQGNKRALAEILAARFPEELGSRLPPKRRPWMSEDYRMDIFDAVGVALAFQLMI